MHSLQEIRDLAKTGETGTFINGIYTVLIEDGKVRGMSPTCWDPRPLWDPYLGILPSTGWRRIK